MTDMIAGEDVPRSHRNFSKVNNLRPADQEEDPSNQPAAKMREQPVAQCSFRAFLNRLELALKQTSFLARTRNDTLLPSDQIQAGSLCYTTARRHHATWRRKM